MKNHFIGNLSVAGPAKNRGCLLALVILFWLGSLVPASADFVTISETWNSGFRNGIVITDGALSGWSDTRTISGAGFSSIQTIQVTLNISGGFNGDYYVYLTHGDKISILLNRVGVNGSDPFGYSNSGLDVTLNDGAVNGDIHTHGGSYDEFAPQLTGTYQPDGRNISPLTAGGTLLSAERNLLLSQFIGTDPNGSWTLFVADVYGGGGSGTVVSWGLEISNVPEPGQWAMAGITLLVAGMIYLRRRAKAAPATDSTPV